MMNKKILFIHFRSGERDGVSLEIEKRRQIFERLGYKTYILTGFDPRSSDDIFLLKELDIKRRISSFLRETFFVEKILDDNLAWLIYHTEEKKIYSQTLKILKKLNPDLIFVHNVFSTAYHLPATTGIKKALDCYRLNTVVVCHDFWWEKNIFHKTKYDFINDILENMPFKSDFIIRHQVINSFAQKKLLEEKKIKAQKIGDYFDFKEKLPPFDDYLKGLLAELAIKDNDLIVLQATRIVERKAIENAILFCQYLQKIIKKFSSFRFFGKRIDEKTRVFLILPNFIEVESVLYFRRLKLFAQERGVNFIWIGDRVGTVRRKTNGLKIYSFWDFYRLADLITYTSFHEGFGNQLFEAFWAKKLPVIFEYPVYRHDIKKEGYQVISLGDKMYRKNGFFFVPYQKIKEAAKKSVECLKDEKLYQLITEKNYLLAKKYHDVSLLEKDLKMLLEKTQ